jgi:hypothetical protein
MGSRADLQVLLLTFCENVYFQEPESHLMKYPCIVYHRDDEDKKYANNKPYKHKTSYQVTVISKDPDSDILSKISALPLSSYDRFFTADGLNHDVYTLFF